MNSDGTQSTPKRSKSIYGWVAAIAGAVGVIAACNFLYTFGVFIKPLIHQFGWSRASISLCASIRNITTAAISPVAGILADRFGPRKLMLTGILLVGLSYLLASRITTLWHLYLSLGILTGVGIAIFFVPTVAIVTRWFGGKSALANGIVYSGFGWAQIILPPIETHLILQYGWETSFIILGTAGAALGVGAWSFIRIAPDNLSESQTEAQQGDPPKAIETANGTAEDYTLSEALHTPTLWTLFLILIVTAASYQMVIIHIIAAAIDNGATPQAAAIILTLNGATNTLGRLTISSLATKIGNKIILIICLAVQAAVLFFLARAGSLNAFYIIATIHGLAYGVVTPIMPTLAMVFFGQRAMGSIFGSINGSYTTGAAIGPFVGGYIFDVTGSYSAAFISAAAAMIIAFVLGLMMKPPQRRTPSG
jgi:MFS family permease